MQEPNGSDRSQDLPSIDFRRMQAQASVGSAMPMPLSDLEQIGNLLRDSCDKIGVDISARFQHRRDGSKVTELQLIQRLSRIKDELASICEFAAQYEEGMTSLDKMAEAEAGQ